MGDSTVDYAYKRCASVDFDSALVAVCSSVERQGFHVERMHDIGAALASKGFPIRPLVIFEVGPTEELDNVAALLMPCRINVYEEDDVVMVAALRPTLFASVFPEHDLDDIARRYEERIVAVVDGAV